LPSLRRRNRKSTGLLHQDAANDVSVQLLSIEERHLSKQPIDFIVSEKFVH
jgi:hypothetical protein